MQQAVAGSKRWQQQSLQGWQHLAKVQFRSGRSSSWCCCRCADKSLLASPLSPPSLPPLVCACASHLVAHPQEQASRQVPMLPVLPMLLGKLIIGINYAFALCGQLFEWFERLVASSSSRSHSPHPLPLSSPSLCAALIVLGRLVRPTNPPRRSSSNSNSRKQFGQQGLSANCSYRKFFPRSTRKMSLADSSNFLKTRWELRENQQRKISSFTTYAD